MTTCNNRMKGVPDFADMGILIFSGFAILAIIATFENIGYREQFRLGQGTLKQKSEYFYADWRFVYSIGGSIIIHRVG